MASYRGRVEITPRVSIEPGLSFNWVDLREGSFTATVVSTRGTVTLTPRIFAGALVQYNSSANALTSNVRFRWEYQPGSELFLVYSDGRDTTVHGFPTLQNRGVVVKINRLFRF